MLHGGPDEVSVIRQALADHREDLAGGLLDLLADRTKNADEPFRAACALAAFAPDDPRWDDAADDVAAKLAAQEPFEIARWPEALPPPKRSGATSPTRTASMPTA